MNQENPLHKKSFASRYSSGDILPAVLALAFGLIVGWLDLQVTEVVVPIVALLVSGLLAGLIRPKAAWRWALMIAAGAAVVEIAAVKFDWQTAEPVQLDFRVAMVEFAFAMLGAYTGVFIRYITRP